MLVLLSTKQTLIFPQFTAFCNWLYVMWGDFYSLLPLFVFWMLQENELGFHFLKITFLIGQVTWRDIFTKLTELGFNYHSLSFRSERISAINRTPDQRTFRSEHEIEYEYDFRISNQSVTFPEPSLFGLLTRPRLCKGRIVLSTG